MQSIWILLGLVVLITARGYGDDDDQHRHRDRGDDDDRHYGDNDDRHHGDNDDRKHHGDKDDKHRGGDDDDNRGDKDDKHRGDNDDRKHGDKDDKHRGDNDDDNHGDKDDKPVYKKKDDSCDFSKRDKYGVPEKLVPANSELVLLVHGAGYRAFAYEQSEKRWLERGRQVKLNDPNTEKCVGSISSDAKTVPLDQDYEYQYSYFADASWATRSALHFGLTNACDKKCAPTASYEIAESSDFDGLLTGVTHVVVFDTHGGAAPSHKGKKDQQVHISNESANYAFYRGAVPEVKPLPKGDDDDKHHGDDDDRHHRYGDDGDKHRRHRYGDDDDDY